MCVFGGGGGGGGWLLSSPNQPWHFEVGAGIFWFSQWQGAGDYSCLEGKDLGH